LREDKYVERKNVIPFLTDTLAEAMDNVVETQHVALKSGQ